MVFLVVFAVVFSGVFCLGFALFVAWVFWLCYLGLFWWFLLGFLLGRSPAGPRAGNGSGAGAAQEPRAPRALARSQWAEGGRHREPLAKLDQRK